MNESLEIGTALIGPRGVEYTISDICRTKAGKFRSYTLRRVDKFEIRNVVRSEFKAYTIK